MGEIPNIQFKEEKQHEKELSVLQTIVCKALTWFPHFREMLRMDDLCRKVGFSEEKIEILIGGKQLEYSGELYSGEHRRKFAAERVVAQITPDSTDNQKLQLKIDRIPIADWFKGRFDKLQHFVRHEQQTRRSKGFKL